MAQRSYGDLLALEFLAGVAVCAPLVIFLIGQHWPHALDGAATFWDKPVRVNYLRNALELLSWAATTLVFVSAVVAFFYTDRQVREARNSRLATLYATLEARWSSDEMQKSKVAFGKIFAAHSAYAKQAAEDGKSVEKIGSFADAYLKRLAADDYAEYLAILSIADYLEYIGMLEERGYLEIKDIDPLLGMIFIQIWSVLSVHITGIREDGRARNNKDGISEAPAEYLRFSELARTFVERYGKSEIA